MSVVPLVLVLTILWPAGVRAGAGPDSVGFRPDVDLLVLNYDHAPDRDDGQSAAADRTILETLLGMAWIRAHVLAVSGAYGTNGGLFDRGSDLVMAAAWDDAGGWLAAHDDREAASEQVEKRLKEVLGVGGDVWIKEGGQSDLTARWVRSIRAWSMDVDTRSRIHVVQHSDWNEEKTTAEALEYTKRNTDYIRIPDANTYLNVAGGDTTFVEAAINHSVFGPVWRAAFEYYSPDLRLDFSDTGELMHILGLGPLGFDAFRQRFLLEGGSGETE